MKALILNFHTTMPVLATRPQSGEENSSTSHRFIPGSMLRGLFVAAFRKSNRVDAEMLLKNTLARHLFFEDKVFFLNAYPFHMPSDARMLPMPLSWRVEKKHAQQIPLDIFDWAFAQKEPLENPHPLADEYVHIPRTGKDVYLYTPATQINVHNASNDRNSKSATSSTVYRYEAIAADEAFQTIVLAENETLQSELEKLLGDDLTLGGSHTGGYGQVSITKIQKMDNWVEVSPSENNQDRVVITLLSDTIVRRQDGQVAGDFDAALRNALALVATSNHLEAFARVRIVGGFNRKAGLPLAQDWALQAGSVFVYRPKDLDLERVRELQSCGIGERRVEGYGRFAINWQWVSKPIGRQTDALLNHLTNLPPVKPSALPTESPWTNSVHQVQQTMATRQLRARLNTEIIRLVSRADLSENLPTNAQLSRVRLAVRDGMTTGNLVMLKNLLENLKAAKQQFAQSRISNESLLEWLKRMCRIDLDRFKSEFGLNEDLPAVGDQVAVLDQAMQVEYISRWIDGVMQKATKQNQAKGVYQ